MSMTMMVRACRMSHARVALWCIGLAGFLGCFQSAAAQSIAVSVLPSNPQAQQPVYAHLRLPGCREVEAVKQEAGVITIEVTDSFCGVAPPGLFDEDVSIGRLPQGSYRLRVRSLVANDPPPPSEISFTVVGPSPDHDHGSHRPLVDCSGWWWNAQRTGEGWFVEHKVPDRLMLSWVTYDEQERPTWYVMQSNVHDGLHLSGPVYLTRGRPPAVTVQRIGQGDFVATPWNANEAIFILKRDGQSGTERVDLTRLPF